MLLVILIGIGYAVWFDSLVAAILTASLIIYRSRRPSQFRQRVREAWYQRAAKQVGEE